MSMRRFFVLPLLALLGCGGGERATLVEQGGDGASQTRDTLVIAYQSDIGNLISVVSETSADNDILTNLSFPVIDTEFDCALEALPGMATEWAWSEDGKVLSMTLRDDLTWEDGTRVTAEDIAFTYELVADPQVASARVASIERMVPQAMPKIVDPTHIEWHFTEAYDRDTQMAHATSLSLVPKHVLAAADRPTLRGHEMGKKPLSYGPWRLADWKPNSLIVLEPNPNFSGPAELKPKLNRVIFRILPEYSTRLIELESGKVDMMQGITVADADKLREKNPDIRLVRRGWRSNDYIAWNLQHDIFKDVRVRRALAHAVDIDGMIGKLLTSTTGEAYARRSIGTVTPELCGVHNDDVKPYPYDPEKAKQLLAEAGWTDTNKDGILDKDGKPFEFTLSTNTGNKRRADIQVLVQAQLERIGVKVHLEKAESNAFFENMRKKRFDAAVAGWSAALFVDPTPIWHCDTESRKYEFNFVSYCNPEVDALMEKGLLTPDPAEAAPIWKEVQAKIYEDQPYLFLWWQDEIVGIHKRFENTKIDVLSALNDLHDWEVPADKVKHKR